MLLPEFSAVFRAYFGCFRIRRVWAYEGVYQTRSSFGRSDAIICSVCGVTDALQICQITQQFIVYTWSFKVSCRVFSDGLCIMLGVACCCAVTSLGEVFLLSRFYLFFFSAYILPLFHWFHRFFPLLFSQQNNIPFFFFWFVYWSPWRFPHCKQQFRQSSDGSGFFSFF